MEVSHHLNFEMLVRQVGWEEWRRWQERRGGDQRPGAFGAVGVGLRFGTRRAWFNATSPASRAVCP